MPLGISESLIQRAYAPVDLSGFYNGINQAAKILDMEISWRGKDLDEVGLLNGQEIIKVDPRYFRPTAKPKRC